MSRSVSPRARRRADRCRGARRCRSAAAAGPRARPSPARARTADDRMWRGGRREHDVGRLERLGQPVEADDGTAEALGDRAGAIGMAVGDEDRRDAARGERLRGQFARLAGPITTTGRPPRSPSRRSAPVRPRRRRGSPAVGDRCLRTARPPVCSAAENRRLVSGPLVPLSRAASLPGAPGPGSRARRRSSSPGRRSRGTDGGRRRSCAGCRAPRASASVDPACAASRPEHVASAEPRWLPRAPGKARCGCRSRARPPRWSAPGVDSTAPRRSGPPGARSARPAPHAARPVGMR